MCRLAVGRGVLALHVIGGVVRVRVRVVAGGLTAPRRDVVRGLEDVRDEQQMSAGPEPIGGAAQDLEALQLDVRVEEAGCHQVKVLVGLELLLPLVRQRGIRLDDLVAPTTVDPRVRRPVIHREGIVIAPLAPEGSSVATYKITYPPADRAPEPRVHDGFEWLYVISGKLRLVLGDQELILVRGEAAEFDTRVPHSLSAAGARPAQMISIFNDDGMRMHTHTAGE